MSSTWTRDATVRVRGRELSGAMVEQWRPGCGGDGDSPALPRSAGGAIGETGQRMPGGVMFSWRVSPTVTEGDRWSYPNIHGDTLVTTDSTGTAVTGLLAYSPDGRPLSGAAANVVGSVDDGWLGSHSRPAEDGATIIGMGARPYLPSIGRFLSVDPVEAGIPNDYVYPADPVNQTGLTGRAVIDEGGGRPPGVDGVCLNPRVLKIGGGHRAATYIIIEKDDPDYGLCYGYCPGIYVRVDTGHFCGLPPIYYESLRDGLRRLHGDGKRLCRDTDALSWLGGLTGTNVGKKPVEWVVWKGAGGPVSWSLWVRDGVCLV